MKTFLLYCTLLLSIFHFGGCSSTQLIEQYKNPETINFQANKVLVVGITADSELRRTFEKKMTEELDKKKGDRSKKYRLF